MNLLSVWDERKWTMTNSFSSRLLPETLFLTFCYSTGVGGGKDGRVNFVELYFTEIFNTVFFLLGYACVQEGKPRYVGTSFS